MTFLEVPGGRLYFETVGNPASPAVLLIHAGVATMRMWDPQVAALAQDHFVIRYDTRGFGLTESDSEPFSNRADAAALLDHVGVTHATLVGASRGGSIALDIALDLPGRVSGLVTIGSGPGGFPEQELTAAENSAFERIGAAEEAGDWPLLNRLEAELWDFGATRDASDLDPGFVATAYALNAANLPHASDDLSPVPLLPQAYGRVRNITVPTLIVVGDHDLSETIAQFEFLADTIPNAESHRFADAAHLPNVEAPAEFETLLLEWLKGHQL
jgi:pimeloyl-ACP methyl ester carboxylesterase